MLSNFEIIEKEVVNTLHFPQSEVLETKEQIQQRICDLNRAMALGNLEHSKIKIYFEDDCSKKVVETTIWALTDEQIVLKQGCTIPINRIYTSA